MFKFKLNFLNRFFGLRTSCVNGASKGFTLIEVLIYMGLVSIFLASLGFILVSSLDEGLRSTSISYIDQDAKYISERLKYDVSTATSVTTPASVGNTFTQLVLVKSGVTYTYSLSSNVLNLTNGTNAGRLNSTHVKVTAFSVTRLGNAGGKNNIRINFTLESVETPHTGARVQNFSVMTGLR